MCAGGQQPIAAALDAEQKAETTIAAGDVVRSGLPAGCRTEGLHDEDGAAAAASLSLLNETRSARAARCHGLTVPVHVDVRSVVVAAVMHTVAVFHSWPSAAGPSGS